MTNLPETKKNDDVKILRVRDVKQRLLFQYRKMKPGISEKLERTSTGFSLDQLMTLIIDELLETAEDLQGTSLMLENEGNLSGSSNMSLKRVELLRTMADVAARKKELLKMGGELDLNSPAFIIFQKMCFDNMIASMEDLNMDQEMIGLLLAKWQNRMANWGNDLKKKLKELDE